jgi:hypothetical protein
MEFEHAAAALLSVPLSNAFGALGRDSNGCSYTCLWNAYKIMTQVMMTTMVY